MKKIIALVLAVFVSMLSVPYAGAADTATLSLDVDFSINTPPVWVIEPFSSQEVQAGEALTIELLAKDHEGDVLSYACRWWLNGVRQDPMARPQGAVWYGKTDGTQPAKLVWNVPSDINLSDTHEFQFDVYEGYSTIIESEPVPALSIKVKVVIKEAKVISIELNNSSWVINKMALNARIDNMGPDGQPLHVIHNSGNVATFVDIGYNPFMPMPYPIPLTPGLEPGLNTYATLVGGMPLPLPGSRMKCTKLLEPMSSVGLSLTFLSPTYIAANAAKNAQVKYELRAIPFLAMSGEPFTDLNNNSVYDQEEPYEDLNHNGIYDSMLE